jgi:hypothetical protein
MMALGFPMQFFFEILGQPYFPFFLVFCESLLSSLRFVHPPRSETAFDTESNS